MVSPAKKELRTSPQRKNDKKRVQIYYSRTHQEEYYEQCLPLSLRSRIATSNNRSPVGCSINSIHKQDMRPNHVLPTAGETSELISQVQTIEQSRNVNVCLSDSHDRVNMGIPRQLGGPNASGDNCIIIHSCTIENADDVRFDNQQSPKQAVIPSGSSFTSSVMKPSQRRVPFFWGAVLPKGVNANVNNGLKLKLSPVSASHTFEENDENFKCHISSCDSVLEKYETRSLDCVEESTNVTYTTRFHTRLKDNIETSKEIIRKKVVEQKEENSQINRDRVSLDSSEVNEKTEGPCSSNSQVVMDNETFTRRYNKMALRNRKTISGYPECPCCRSAEGNKVHRHDNMSEHLVSSSNCESPCRLSRMASRRFSMATVYHVKEQLPVSRQHSLSHNGKVDVHLESEKKEEDSPSTSKEDSNSVTRSVAVSCLMEDIKLKMKAVVLLNRLSPVIENIPKRKMESETSKVNSVLKKNVCQSSSCIPVDTSSKSLTSTKRQKCIKIEEIASSGQQHSLGCYSECEATVRGTDYGVVPDHGMKRQRRSGLRSKQTEYYPVISNSLTETINSEETFNRNVSQPNNSAVADNSTSCLSPVKHPQSGEVESDSRSGTVQETLANFNTNECLLKSHYAIVSRKRSLQRSAKLECCSATSESHPETLNEKEALNLNVSPANHFTVTNTSPSSLSPVNPPKCRKGETTKDGQLDSLVSDSESEPVKEGLGSFFTTETPLKSKDVKKLRSRHTKLDYSVLSDIEQLTTNSEDVLRQNASQPKNSTFSDKSSSFLSSTKRLKCRKVGEISASEQLESFDDDSEITETETSLKPKHVIKNKRISGRRSTKMKPHSSINDGELKSFNSQETLNRQVLSSSCDIIGMKRKHSACEKVEDDGERGVELSTVSVSVVEGNSQNELKLDEKQTYHDVQKVGKAKRRSVSLTKKLKSFIHRENNESRAPKKNLKLGKNAHHPNNSPVTNSSIQNNIFHQSRSDVEGATCLPLKSLKRGTVSEVVSATQFDDNEKSPNLRKVAKTKKSPVDRNNKSESFNSVHDSKTEALITNMTVLENSQPCTRSVTKTRSSSSGSSINPSRYRTRQQSGASHLLSDSGDELASKANLKVCKTKKLDMSPNLCRNRAKSGGQVEKRETPQISHSESERSDEIRHRLCNRSLFIDSGSNLIHPEFNNSERVLNSPNIAKTQRSVTGLRSVDSNPTDDCERDILNNKLTAESVQLLTSSSTDDCSVIFKNNRATRAKGKKTQKSLGRRRVQCLGSDSGSEVTRDSQLDTHEKSFILPTTTRIKRLVRKSRKARMLNYTDSSESDCLVEKCTSNETALQENNAVIENSTSNVLLTGSKRGEAEECTKELLFDSVVKDTETDMNDSKKISPNSTTNSELHDLDKVGQICCHEPEVLDGCIREQSACTIEENSFNPTRNHSKNPDGEGSVVSTNEVVNQTSSTFDSNEMLMDLKTTTENKSNSVNRFRTGTSCSQNNDSESEILKCCPKSGSTRRTPPTVNNKQQAPGNLPYLTTDFEGLCLREMPLNHLEECIEAVVKRNAESDDDHGPPGAHMEERHCNLHEVLSEKSLHQEEGIISDVPDFEKPNKILSPTNVAQGTSSAGEHFSLTDKVLSSMDDEVACTPLIELAMKKLSGTHFLEPISENLGMSSVLHFGVSTAPSESITFESENWSRIRKSEWCIPNFSSMSSNFNSLSITENNIGELTSTKENPANNLLMNSILLSQRSDKRSHRSLQEISCLRASDIYCDIDDTSSVRNGFQRAEISLSSSDRQQLKEGGNFYRNVTRDVLDLTDSYHKTREETSLLLNDRNFLSVDDSEELPAFPTVSSHDGDKGSVFAISSLSDDDEYQKLLTGNYTECDGLECELDFDRGGSSCLAIPETHIAGRQIISQLSAAEEDLTYDIGHKDLQSTYRLCPHASLTVTDGSARCDETLLKNSHLEGENTLKISAHSLSPTADDTMFMQNFHPSTNSPHQNDGGELSFGNQNSSHSITSHEVDCDFTLTESNLEGSSDFLTVECDITNDRHESKQKDDFVYMTDTDLTPFCNYNFKEGLNLTATDLSHESRFSNDVESQKNNEEPLHDENLQFMNVSLCSDDFQKQICRDGMTTEPSQSTNVHDDLICGPSFLQNEKGRIHGDALVVDQQFDSENSNVATAATLTVDVSSCRFSNSDLQDPLPNTCASSSGDQLSGTSLPDSQQQDATPVNFQNDTSYCQTKDDRLSLDDFNMEVDQQSDSENSTVRTATPLAGRSADIKSGHSVEMTLLLDNDSNDDALSLMAPSIDNDSLLGLSAVDNPPMPAVQTKLRSPKRVNETVKETKHTLITFLPTATEKTETEKDCSSSSSHVGGDSGVSSESAIHASSIENKNVFELLEDFEVAMTTNNLRNSVVIFSNLLPKIAGPKRFNLLDSLLKHSLKRKSLPGYTIQKFVNFVLEVYPTCNESLQRKIKLLRSLFQAITRCAHKPLHKFLFWKSSEDSLSLSELYNKVMLDSINADIPEVLHLYLAGLQLGIVLKVVIIRALIVMFHSKQIMNFARDVFNLGALTGIYPLIKVSEWSNCLRLRSYFTENEIDLIFNEFLLHITRYVRALQRRRKNLARGDDIFESYIHIEPFEDEEARSVRFLNDTDCSAEAMCKRVTNVLSRKCNGTIEFDIDQNCRIVRIDRYAMEAFIVNFEKTDNINRVSFTRRSPLKTAAFLQAGTFSYNPFVIS